MFSPPAVPKMFETVTSKLIETVTSKLRYHYIPNVFIDVMYIIIMSKKCLFKLIFSLLKVAFFFLKIIIYKSTSQQHSFFGW